MRRDRLVTFLRDTGTARNALNEPVEDFEAIGTAYAARADMDQTEARAAGETMVIEMARFVVRANAITDAITGDDRLSVAGQEWKITGNTPDAGSRRGYRTITAVRRANG